MKNLFLISAVLFLTSSFKEGPATFIGSEANSTVSTAIPFGGAYLVFAGKYGGEVTKKEIEGQRDLSVEGCAKGSRIFKFTLSVTKKGQWTSYQAESNALSSAMQSVLKNLSPGDSFEFKEVKAYLPNGKEVVNVHGEKFMVV